MKSEKLKKQEKTLLPYLESFLTAEFPLSATKMTPVESTKTSAMKANLAEEASPSTNPALEPVKVTMLQSPCSL